MGRPAPTIAIKTLGCKVNQADSDYLLREFAARGFEPVPFGEPADAIVVNTCTVTHVADRKSRQLISRAIRRSPGCVVGVTGCYAAVDGAAIARAFPGVLVVPPARSAELVQDVCERLGVSPSPRGGATIRKFGENARHRPMVKVQEGCDHVCSFCIVPRARGRSVSQPSSRILEEVNRLFGQGAKEIVLTGVSMSGYLCPESGLRLGGLVSLLLDGTEVPRLRLSSVEPMGFDERIFDLLGAKRLCPHLHLPLQSGCDEILQLMRRPYTRRDFLRLADMAREAQPDVAITTDVLVGFPGEGERQFQETLGFLERVGFAALHVFPYSRRGRTLAARRPDSVSAADKNDRVSFTNELGRRLERAYSRRFDGRRRQVLWETEHDGALYGLTDNYLRVSGPADRRRVGELQTVTLSSLPEGGMIAEQGLQPALRKDSVGLHFL